VGNAVFWYYPDPDGTLEEVDLGEGISNLFWEPERQAEDAIAGDAGQYRELGWGRLRVFISLERMKSGAALARSLENMQSHLERNGAVAFCADKDKAVAVFAKSTLQRGDQAIFSDGNPFAVFNSSAAMAANDVVCVQTPSMEANREWADLTTWTSEYSFALNGSANGVLYSTDSDVIMVRYQDFFPVLRMPIDQINRNIVTHEHRIGYTLDIQLVEDPSGWTTFSGEGAILRPTQTDGIVKPDEGFGQSIDQIISINGEGFTGGGTEISQSTTIGFTF